ncbi:MAG: riboflavin biosynthesis protein RibF, partial [Bacteroidales bacterium]|nr:riboflavin biosynthesis protein RibF [Bacteroidales bacterium]
YGHTGPFGLLENGNISLEDFRNEIRTIFGITAGDEEIDQAWAAFLEDIPLENTNIVHNLSKKYRVFLLSNTNPVHIRKLKQFEQAGHLLNQCFEKRYLSYEIGLSKPHREFFEHVLKDSCLKAEECLFIDDGPANCRSAEALGIKTLCPENVEELSKYFPEMISNAASESRLIQKSQNKTEPFMAEKTVATIGFFDGVHLGHQQLIASLRQKAAQKNLSSLVLAFWPHPRMVLHSDYCPQLLNDCSEKLALLQACGADNTKLIRFHKELSEKSAYEFMNEVLKKEWNVSCLLIGYDHHFGKNRRENFDDYRRYGDMLNMEVLKAEPVLLPESSQAISSSFIREALLKGEIIKANAALGYDYTIKGKVGSGYRVGRKLGFPTANIIPSDPHKLIPMPGSYIVTAEVENKLYPGMLNIGQRPTLQNGRQRSIEVHLLDFSGDLYEKEIAIYFKKHLRPEKRFPSTAELTNQLILDKEAVLRFFGQGEKKSSQSEL